jgi:hypothetical protein
MMELSKADLRTWFGLDEPSYDGDDFIVQPMALRFTGNGMSASADFRCDRWEVSLKFDMADGFNRRYVLHRCSVDAVMETLRVVFAQAPDLLRAASELSRQTDEAYDALGDFILSAGVVYEG